MRRAAAISNPSDASPRGPPLEAESLLSFARFADLDFTGTCMTESGVSSFDRPVEIFRQAWSLYDRLVVENFMRHREMEQGLRSLLSARSTPPALLDLGCGDSALIARALPGLRVGRYVGVELVAEVAAQAARRMGPLVPDCQVVTGNLAEIIRRPELGRFDLAFASYSVHHLSNAEKSQLFLDLPRRLSPAGSFVLIDLVLREGEDRHAYLQRFHEFVRTSWTGLTEDERLRIRDHMDSSDWPESLPDIQRMAATAGFVPGELLYRDPEEFYALIHFRRPETA
jgi:hypothetical protein